MFTPEVASGGLETNHKSSLAGLIWVYPPSPKFTFCQLLPVDCVPGDLFPWVPPRMVLASVGDWEKEINWVIDPSVMFRLSNGLVPPQVPVSRLYPSSARYIPPSLAKYITSSVLLLTRNDTACCAG